MSKLLVTTLLNALKENPGDEALILNLARAYREEGDDAEALHWLQQLIANNSKHEKALLQAIEIGRKLNETALCEAYEAILATLTPAASVTPINNAGNKTDKRIRGHKLTLVADHGVNQEHSFVEVEDSSVYLSDVSGMEAVKKRLQLSFLGPINNPELVKQFGKKVSGGLILYGPPGCGKTFIARALAGELGAKFITITLSDILDMYIGESEKRLHEIFEVARRNAPAVLFFDELDAIGQKRASLKSSGMRTLVNQLLSELDSVDNNNDGVFFLGATNLPWDIDVALKRPGRFDRVVAVFPPDYEARKSIISQQLKNTPCAHISIDELAAQTHLFSGADLSHLCQSAIEEVFEAALTHGEVRNLEQSDFDKPLADLKPSTKEWFTTARNYALFSNQAGIYDDLLRYIKDNKLQ